MLQNIPLFSALADKQIELLNRIAKKKTFSKNVIIAHEGEPLEAFYVILSGSVKVFLSDHNGKELTLDLLKPGDYFGEISLIEGACHAASFVSVDKVTLAAILKNDFINLLNQHRVISNQFLQDLILKIHTLTGNIKNFALCDVYGRLTNILQEMAIEKQGCLLIEERITIKELASRIGASPKMVGRILKDLSAGGYIKFEKGRISIEKRLPDNY